MSYDLEKLKAGRKPVSSCELVQDFCAFEYGQSYENLLMYSEEFSNAAWSKTVTVTENVILAPDGTLTGDKVEDINAVSPQYIVQTTPTFTPDWIERTASVYVKKGDLSRIFFWFSYYDGAAYDSTSGWIDFDLGIIIPHVGEAVQIEYITDGWFRVWASIQNDATNDRFSLRVQGKNWGETETGYWYQWGGQAVESNKPGHYVKTTSAAATAGCSASNAKANLITYSEQFDHVNWGKVRLSVTHNVAGAPDGSLTADQLVFTGVADPYMQQSSGTLDPSGKTYTISVWAYAPASQPKEAQLYIYGNSALESKEQKNITLTTSWKRYSISTTFPASASSTAVNFRFDGPPAPSAGEYQFIWGAQLVEGDIPGNYYKTEATAHTGSIGIECCNTWATCEVQADYKKHLKGYRHSQPTHPIAPGTIPCIVGEPRFTSARAEPDKGLGVRSQVNITLKDFTHHDRGVDPYVSGRTYNPSTQGTYWGKWLARNPYWESRTLLVNTGYHTDSGIVIQTRAYIIDSISSNGETIAIKGKDVLKLVDSDRTKIPTISEAALLADITAAAVSCTLDDYDQLPDDSGVITIGDETMDYVKVGTPATSLTLSNRGGYNTEASDHEADDSVQHAYIPSQNIVDEIFDALHIYGGIPKSYLPYDAKQDTPTGVDDEWDLEKDLWFSGHTLGGMITEPIGVNEYLKNITENDQAFLWWEEVDQEVKLKANMPPASNAAVTDITQNSHLIKDSVKVKVLPSKRISQAWAHYNRINPNEDDKKTNYAGHTARIDTDSEGENETGTSRIKELFARYYTSSAVPGATVNRLVNRYAIAPKEVSFDLDAKDDAIKIGYLAEITSRHPLLQSTTGESAPTQIQIIEKREVKAGHLYTYKAITSVFLHRYAFIAPAGTPDYGSATDEQKRKYGFIIATGERKFSDGGGFYAIL